MKNLKRIFSILCMISMLLVLPVSANGDAVTLNDIVKYTYTDEGFKFELNEGKVFEASDKIGIIILKPGYGFKEKNGTELITSELNTATYDVKMFRGYEITDIIMDKTFETGESEGQYSIRLTRTDYKGNYESITKVFSNVEKTKNDTLIKEFTLTDAKEFSSIFDKYKATAFDYSDYIDFETLIKASGEEFVNIRDGVLGKNSENLFVDKAEIFDTMKMAISLNALNNEELSVAEERVKTYGCIYSDRYDYSYDFEAFYKLYQNTKTDIKTYEDVAPTFIKTCAMAKMQNGSKSKTVQQIMDCINENAKVIGADLDYLSTKGVELSAVAQLIDSNNIFKYYDDANWFKDIVDSVKKDEEPESVITSNKRPNNVTISQNKADVSVSVPNVITPTEKEMFKDIVLYPWAVDAIKYLYEKDIVSGDGNGNYSPYRNITREEFVKMICGAFGVKVSSAEEKVFMDADVNAWYYPYLKIASSNKIINGIDANNFGVGKNITRQDMAVILLNVMTYKEKSVIAYENGFSDYNQIPDYAKDAVNVMSKIGVINGFSDGTFGGTLYATRAQAAVMIYRLLDYLN